MFFDSFFESEMFFDNDIFFESEIPFDRVTPPAAFLDRIARLATGLSDTETPEVALFATGADFLVDSRLLINDFFWIAMVFFLSKSESA
jgi:hypothetical protein